MENGIVEYIFGFDDFIRMKYIEHPIKIILLLKEGILLYGKRKLTIVMQYTFVSCFMAKMVVK